ncbi:hypothetical protein N7467_002548 [Penicillium canescens]|nr:hypothetical protein N7467_002548 [Penicillium canescens]
MSSNRRSKQVGNINYAPDFIKALDNSASKIAGCYGFATTASLHKTYSTDPSFQHSRDVIDQFATDRIRFSIIKHGFDNAQKWSPALADSARPTIGQHNVTASSLFDIRALWWIVRLMRTRNIVTFKASQVK